MRPSLLHELLAGHPHAATIVDPAEGARLAVAPIPDPSDAPPALAGACLVAACTDRLGVAFAAGYQAGLHALVPGLAPGQLASLCVTEEHGNSPSAIQCELRDGRLFGDKRFATLGPVADLLLVLARDGVREDGRPRLRVLRIDPRAEGVTIDLLAPTRFVPEVPHARLRLQGVLAPEERVVPGDGWDDVVRPFRTVEDLYVGACSLAFALSTSRRAGLPSITEACAALLASTTSLARRPPADPALHLAVAGLLPLVRGQLEQLAAADPLPDPVRELLRRDLPLLAVAEPARRARTERARTLLAVGSLGTEPTSFR